MDVPQSLHTLIVSTRGSLNAIYPAFILTITNISPYLKNPTIPSSTRLLQLFLAMSSPNFLLSDEANPRLVYYLLEAFNNVIQFQLSGLYSARKGVTEIVRSDTFVSDNCRLPESNICDRPVSSALFGASQLYTCLWSCVYPTDKESKSVFFIRRRHHLSCQDASAAFHGY